LFPTLFKIRPLCTCGRFYEWDFKVLITHTNYAIIG
jgi:hypothetical protein